MFLNVSRAIKAVSSFDKEQLLGGGLFKRQVSNLTYPFWPTQLLPVIEQYISALTRETSFYNR